MLFIILVSPSPADPPSASGVAFGLSSTELPWVCGFHSFYRLVLIHTWRIFSFHECSLLTLVETACIWYGVQAYIGGHCVYLMIRSIWKAWVSDSLYFPRNTMFILTVSFRTVTRFPTPSLLHQAPRQPILSLSSSSGSAHCPPSGSLSTKSAICLPSRPTLSPPPPLPS